MVALAIASAPVATAAAQQSREEAAAETRALGHASRLERAGRLTEARQLLEELLDSYPTSFDGLLALGRVLEALNQPEVLVPFAERAAVETGLSDDRFLQVWIRTLGSEGALDSAWAVADDWVARAPDQPQAYLELAFVERDRGGAPRGIEVLERGRDRVGDAEIFTQELSLLYAEAERLQDAAREWRRMLAWGRPGGEAVERALVDLGDRYTAALQALAVELARSDVPLTAARTGLEMAFRLGDRAWTRELAESMVESLPLDARLSVLRDFVLEARNRGLLNDAAWAASMLAEQSPTRDERLQWKAVAAELAFQTGDSASARDAFSALAGEAEVGTEAHRIATRRVFSLWAESPQRAEPLLHEYARAYPEAEQELAEMAVELARAYAADGELAAAMRALEVVAATPDDASVAALVEAERGRLALYAGDLETARASLAVAVAIPAGAPAERTEVIALYGVLARADSVAAAALGAMLYRLLRDPRGSSVAVLVAEWEAMPSTEFRVGLAALVAAELEQSGRSDDAAAVRRWIIASHPEAPEAASALLGLARAALPADPELARHYLEQLIVTHPTSAVAPAGRRLLAELEGRVPS